jgi:hypothetical protein
MLKNYDTATFYKKLIDIISYISTFKMLERRIRSSPTPFPIGYHLVKTLGNRQMIRRLQEILNLINTDPQFKAFHEHKTEVLPEFYHRKYENLLGKFAPLISREERKPVLVSHKKRETTAKVQTVTTL